MFPQMQDVLWKGYIVDLASWWESEMQFIHVHPTVYLTRLCLFFQWMRDGHNSIQKSSGLLKECEQRDANSESRHALPNPSKLSGLSLLVLVSGHRWCWTEVRIDTKIMVITETFWLNTNWCLDASPSVWFCGLTNISATCFNTFASSQTRLATFRKGPITAIMSEAWPTWKRHFSCARTLYFRKSRKFCLFR